MTALPAPTWRSACGRASLYVDIPEPSLDMGWWLGTMPGWHNGFVNNAGLGSSEPSQVQGPFDSAGSDAITLGVRRTTSLLANSRKGLSRGMRGFADSGPVVERNSRRGGNPKDGCLWELSPYAPIRTSESERGSKWQIQRSGFCEPRRYGNIPTALCRQAVCFTTWTAMLLTTTLQTLPVCRGRLI